jgi:dihydroorotate dehydrogenase (fumarate)
VKYAGMIAKTGVAALELNFYNVPFSFDKTAEEIENEQLDIVEAVIAAVDIPISVKLSRFYTNPLGMVKKLDALGVKGVILFNKLFQPDVDIIGEKHVTPWNLSSPEEYKLPLRYAGLLSGEIEADIIGNTGIYTGKDVLKVILAGANNVQIVSTLYKNGVNHIESMLKEMTEWMDVKGYNTLDDFRGKLSRKNMNNPYIYKRAQYIDIILNSERILG